MYSARKIPAPFNGTPQKHPAFPKPEPVQPPAAEKSLVPETTETKTSHTKQSGSSPLLALLLLDLFSTQKKDG